jgi:hypothetical protein
MIHLIFPACRFSVVTGVPPVCAQSAAGTAATTAQSPFSSTYHHSSHGEPSVLRIGELASRILGRLVGIHVFHLES